MKLTYCNESTFIQSIFVIFQTFNKMKEKLRTAQSRSENKNRNLYKRSYNYTFENDAGLYALASGKYRSAHLF